MKSSPFTITAVALVALMGTLSEARGDLISWSYNWSRSPAEILADAPGTSKITLTDEKEVGVTGNSNIVATNLRTESSADSSSPDTFTNAGFTLYLNLKDLTSGLSTTLSFTGVMNGTLSSANSNLFATPTGDSSQEVTIGGNVYKVDWNTSTPPGVPGADNVGSIGFHVTVKGGGGVVASVPEPGTLTLLGVGLALLGASRRRRVPQRRRVGA